MSDSWGVPRVRRLAPDQRSFAAAQSLSRSGRWSSTGVADHLLWGRCQGSGAHPYQVTVDLTGPTVTCTCPSHKVPCKHGLAMILRWIDQGAAFGDGAPHAGAAGPPARRPALQPDQPVDGPADPVAARRRLEDRLVLMDSGIIEFQRWIRDLLADGLASAKGQPHAWWDRMAARLVDAQMGALADRVRGMPKVIADNQDWADRLLAEVARWHLTCHTWQRRDSLPPEDVADLRTFLGWPWKSAEILAGERAEGPWHVLGVGASQSGRLIQQRTWLGHARLGIVMVLDFAAGRAEVTGSHLVGAVLHTSAGVYPGRCPRRVRFASDPISAAEPLTALPGAVSGWGQALEGVAGMISSAPWQDRFPVIVGRVRLVDVTDRPALVDDAGQGMSVFGVDAWKMLAATAGRPVDVFGELVDGRVRPLSMVVDGQLCPVPGLVA